MERRGHAGEAPPLRRVLRVIKRTIDRHGQRLLVPGYEVHGYLTTLAAEIAHAETIIRLYPAESGRLRMAIQEMMCIATAIAHHARKRFLVFGVHCPALTCLARLHQQWAMPEP